MLIAVAAYLPSRRKKDIPKNPAKILAAVLVAFAVALLAVSAGHGMRGLFIPLSEATLRSDALLAASRSFAGKIPLPFPAAYIDAIDYLLLKKSSYFVYYMNGSLSSTGWSRYFLEAAALKYPIPLLLLTGASFFALFRKDAKLSERMLWIPVVCIFALFSFVLRVDSGVRYLLPALPFIIVLAAARLSESLSSENKPLKYSAAVLLLWHCASFAAAPGNALSYFNEFAGGPRGGARYLVESNIDWGQNLIRLKQHAKRNNLQPLLVYNYGLTPPQAYGIRAGWAPCKPQKAVVAISVNYLNGLDPFQRRPRECFDWLRKMEPIEKIGGGLYVYDAR